MIPLLRAASIVLQTRSQKSTNLVLLNLSKAASNSLNMLKLSPTLKPMLSASSFSYRVYGSGEWVTLHITCRRDCASDTIYSRCRCSKENTSDPGARAVATAFKLIGLFCLLLLHVSIIFLNLQIPNVNTKIQGVGSLAM